ncbi:methyltransferase domain-containing protein [Streptomyces sp. bgisy034]|uniref:methyltransferase domain-containing protein n=1 Tax=Streptomyces sp. bgisy034 TaxID=3413774 RepID=UPI003EB778D5
MTENGKADDARLADLAAPTTGSPSWNPEELVLALGREVLGDSAVTLDDSFSFDGDSAPLMSLIARVAAATGITLPASKVLRQKNLREIAALLGSENGTEGGISRDPDPCYADPRLARIYDAFAGDREDLTAYVEIADQLGADKILDVGCGTGTLALLLAEGGRTVVGVDPAAACVEIAKSKDRTQQVTWIQGDATSVPGLGSDLAVMTGHVAQVIFAEDDWKRTLQGVHDALRPGGHLVFETRRPEGRPWERWAANDAPYVLDIPGIGPVAQRCEVTDVSLPLVSVRYTYEFEVDGEILVSDSIIRFRDRDEVELTLAAHGYRVVEVREAPDRPGRELVFIAQRAD